VRYSGARSPSSGRRQMPQEIVNDFSTRAKTANLFRERERGEEGFTPSSMVYMFLFACSVVPEWMDVGVVVGRKRKRKRKREREREGKER